MQSDLDMASSWLSKQTNDLDLLLRSRDLFTRLQIGGLEFKHKTLDSLIQLLSEDENSGSVVAKEVNLNCLIHLLDPIYPDSVRDLAIVAASMLDSVMREKQYKAVLLDGGDKAQFIKLPNWPLGGCEEFS
ncbi:unnamed protein product [Fraxinus pennsylvanica]|uniref:Uncharacterized protein n=1 Tax=Fraxinus pennsylvanica TaxID=56036 RepID=A0AAD1YPX1_9LAMI|nr:unnamed protein product [Fraxinus pennsylvanica]